MLGNLIGDIVGSTREIKPIKTKDFDLFPTHSKLTDDTVLTISIADAILSNKDYESSMLEWGRKYPKKRYGTNMQLRILGESNFNESFGNGAAMRVSPVGWLFNTKEDIFAESSISASITHNSIDGIISANAVALAVYFARIGKSKGYIKNYIQKFFKYDLNRSVDQIRETYDFSEKAIDTVPESIICFLESTSFEDAIRNAVSLGGDSDTMACIAGGVAEAYYKVIPKWIVKETLNRLPEDILEVLDKFDEAISK